MKITLPASPPAGVSFEIANTSEEPITIGVEQIPFGSTRTYRQGSELSTDVRRVLDDYEGGTISTGLALQALVALGVAMALVNAVDFAVAGSVSV